MTLVIDPKPGKNVRITNPDHPLVGKTGQTVCVAHHLGNKIWVDMDDPLPNHLIKFAGFHDSRRNWVIFDPEDLEEMESTSKGSLS